MELMDHMAVLFLVFWAVTILFSIVATPIYIPTNRVKGSHFSTSLPTFVICLLFDNSHSEMCGDTLLWFWFTFPWCLWCWVSFFFFVVNFVIHWHESAMGLHVFPIPIPPPTSLSTRSLWVFPVHQARALVSCTQPGLVICFTLDNIHVSMLFSWTIPPSPSPTESKRLFYKSVSFFFFSVLHIGLSLTSF